MTDKSYLGDKMKKLEEKGEESRLLEPTKPWIARLDGRCFHRFCSVFEKPFDITLHSIMTLVAKDLLDEYKPTTAYTFSDEITLVFPVERTKKDDLKEIMFCGRIMKISTVMAGFCSSRFTFHCFQAIERYPKTFPGYSKVIANLREGIAHFDCRMHSVDDNQTLVENLVWRMRDCLRNSKIALARKYFSQKEINKLNQSALVWKLIEEKNVNWNMCIPAQKWGTFVKKESYEKTRYVEKFKKTVTCTRHRHVELFLIMDIFEEKYEEFLVERDFTKLSEEMKDEVIRGAARVEKRKRDECTKEKKEKEKDDEVVQEKKRQKTE